MSKSTFGIKSENHTLNSSILCYRIVIISKVVVYILVCNKLPSLVQLSVKRISLAVFINYQTCILSITYTYAIIAKVIVITFNFFNAYKLNAVYIVTVLNPTSCYNTINIKFAISIYTVEDLAANTLKNTVDKCVGMTCSRNDGAPLNRRITCRTVSSAFITGSCTCGCYISYRLYCMNMITVVCMICFTFSSNCHINIICVRLCIYMDIISRECATCFIKICNNTFFNNYVNRYSSNSSVFPCNCRISDTAFVKNVLPNTNRKTC